MNSDYVNLVTVVSLLLALAGVIVTAIFGFRSSRLQKNLTDIQADLGDAKTENNELHQNLQIAVGERDQLLKSPCAKLRHYLNNYQNIPDLAGELGILNERLASEEDARVAADGTVIPLCVWREIITKLCTFAQLTEAASDAGIVEHQDDIAEAAAELLVTILHILVGRRISGASDVIETLTKFIVKCPPEQLLRTARICGLVCKACALSDVGMPGPGEYVHSAACRLFDETVAQLHRIPRQNLTEWNELVSVLVTDCMPPLCIDGPSLRRLLTSVWHALVYKAEAYDAISCIADALFISGPNNAVFSLTRKDRQPLIGMVRNSKAMIEGKIRNGINGVRHPRPGLDGAINQCDRVEAFLQKHSRTKQKKNKEPRRQTDP